MSVMMLDYGTSYSHDDLHRFADVGCQKILLFDRWWIGEPERDHYDFDFVRQYATQCRRAGLQLLVQSPIGAPHWCPDQWFLQNEQGERNTFQAVLQKSPPGSYEHTIALSQRFTSYWNPEAEQQVQRYVQNLRQVVESAGGTCISSIGPCGEYLFPAVAWYPFLETTCSPWWFDNEAAEAWKSFQQEYPDQTQAQWLHAQLHEITARRLSWYPEKWLQYVPYHQGWAHLGVDGVQAVLESQQENLKTILFTVFAQDFEYQAALQAQKYPTWGGAEGIDHILQNGPKARALGLQGVICGPLWFDYHYSRMEPWMFDTLRETNRFWEQAL